MLKAVEPVVKVATGRWEYCYDTVAREHIYLHVDCDTVADEHGYCIACGKASPTVIGIRS